MSATYQQQPYSLYAPQPRNGFGAAFDTEAEVLARLDKLRRKRAEAKRTEAAILADILNVMRIAGSMRINGEPIDRSVLIEHSGVSRKTAYRAFDPLPKGDEPWPKNLSPGLEGQT